MPKQKWSSSIKNGDKVYQLVDYTCAIAPPFFETDNPDMKHICIDKEEVLKNVLTYLYGTLHDNKMPDDSKRFVYIDVFNDRTLIYLLNEEQHNRKNPQNICST